MAGKQQLSNKELDFKLLRQNGAEPLYYYDSPDYGTIMWVNYIPAKECYSAGVYIGEGSPTAKANLPAYAQAMADDLRTWAHTQNVKYVDPGTADAAPALSGADTLFVQPARESGTGNTP